MIGAQTAEMPPQYIHNGSVCYERRGRYADRGTGTFYDFIVNGWGYQRIK